MINISNSYIVGTRGTVYRENAHVPRVQPKVRAFCSDILFSNHGNYFILKI